MINPDLLTRRLAIDIFDAVFRRGKELEEEYAFRMERHEKKSPLETRDRTFVRLLVTVMLRRLGQIDAVISSFLKKPLPEKAAYVLDVLRIGTAQLVFLDTPPHAAVSTSVSLIKNGKYDGFSGLANAVLHKIAKEGKSLAERQNPARLNIPAWMFDQWAKEYGPATAEKIALADLNEAPLDITVKENPEFWARELDAVVMPTGSLRRKKQASVPSLNGYDGGNWWVQDLSAAMPARLFHDPKGKKAIDICAAPGGKTAQLIAAGADVTAIDISENRVKRLKENLDRLKMDAETVSADFLEWAKNNQRKYDLVLLDAPCSATGTLRRHPDVACHRSPQDVSRLNATQKQLLEAAVRIMKDDAELVYCVCSVLPQEGRLIVDDAVRNGLAERVPVQPSEAPAEMISKDGDLLILPFCYESEGGCDGFYAARLKKKGAKK